MVGIKLIVEVLDHAPADLTPQECLLLVVLAESARDETGHCWPGRAVLARRLRRSPSTVERVLRSLVGRGLVETAQRAAPGRTPVYRINVRHLVTHERESSGDARSGPTCLTSGPNVSHSGPQRVASGDSPSPQEPSGEPSNHPRARADDETAAVIAALRDRTGKTIDQHHAALVIKQLVDGRAGVGNRVAYLRGAISRDPDPARFLPTYTPPPYRRENHQ